MLNAPITKSETKPTTSLRPVAPEATHELNPRFARVTGPYASGLRQQPTTTRLQAAYGNQAILRALNRAAPTASGALLQRKCVCGSTPGPTGECATCRAKRLQHQGVLQPKLTVGSVNDPYEQEADRVAEQIMRMPTQIRKATIIDRDIDSISPLQRRLLAQEQSSEASLIVHDVLHSSSQPLSPATRSFTESWLDNDFHHIYVHTGAQASESARAVNSVISVELLQRAEDGDATDLSSTEQLEDKPKKVCGPNVTKQLKNAQIKTRKKFADWKNSRKEEACQDLVSIIFGWGAWDIIQLNENDWILSHYGSQCASRGASPSCIKSVQIDSQCFYAGSVNYAHFGNMFDLCQGYYASAYPLNKQFTQNEMLRWIDIYKGTGITGLATPAPNFQSSVDWALAGFFNWPHGALTPQGDRSNCSSPCALPYTDGEFDVNWSGETF